MGEKTHHLDKLLEELFDSVEKRDEFIHNLSGSKEKFQASIWIGHPQSLPTQALPNGALVDGEFEPPEPWQGDRIRLINTDYRAGKDPLHESGAFYLMDVSSAIAGSILRSMESPPRVIVDVCASPGGKSVFAYAHSRPKFLVANEVVPKRLGALISNLSRCQVAPAFVLNKAPDRLPSALEQACDLVIVDAPCSGQSLLAKGEKNPGCFHAENINMNANRQRFVISNSAELVAPGGYLAYMTCTYSPKENEKVIEWFLKKNADFEPQTSSLLHEFQSHLSHLPCYRIWPGSGHGAGGFAALLRRNTGFAKQEVDLSYVERIVRKDAIWSTDSPEHGTRKKLGNNTKRGQRE